MVGQLADEADGVDDDRLARHFGGNTLRLRVERGEKLVHRHGVAEREAIEQRRLAGVGVAHQSDGECAAPRLALRLARLLDVLQVLLEARDARTHDAAVELELRLTDAALRSAARAAGLALEVR